MTPKSELINFLAMQCSVPPRFAEFVLSVSDQRDPAKLIDKINFLKGTINTYNLSSFRGNEISDIEIESMAITLRVPIHAVQLALLTERNTAIQYHCQMTRHRKILFIHNVLSYLDKLLDFYLP